MAIRGEGRKKVEGVCVQVGKGTCDINWRIVSTASRSSRSGRDQLGSGELETGRFMELCGLVSLAYL